MLQKKSHGCLNFYRLGPTKEKALFKKHKDVYKGIIIPAHIASYFSKFCAGFIGSLQKPYFIDPITYIFARGPELIQRYLKDRKTGRTLRDALGGKKKGEIRRSYKKIVEHDYRSIIYDVARMKRALRPSDFTSENKLDEFVNNVVKFQLNKLSKVPEKYKKYERYASKESKKIFTAPNFPIFVVPPYFYFNSIEKEGWYQVNLTMIRKTKEVLGKGPRIFSVIFTSCQLLSKESKRIIDDYGKSQSDGFLLWVDDFSGYRDLRVLRIVKKFLKSLAEVGKDVIMLYGDYFSILLGYFGLKGFSCGICYGEHKSADQDLDVEGAIPPRYYIELIKKKVQIETEIRRIDIPKEFPDFLCSCAICQRKSDPVMLDDFESKEHFLIVRANEIKRYNEGLTASEQSKLFSELYNKYRNEPYFSPLAHLNNWSKILLED